MRGEHDEEGDAHCEAEDVGQEDEEAGGGLVRPLWEGKRVRRRSLSVTAASVVPASHRQLTRSHSLTASHAFAQPTTKTVPVPSTMYTKKPTKYRSLYSPTH